MAKRRKINRAYVDAQQKAWDTDNLVQRRLYKRPYDNRMKKRETPSPAKLEMDIENIERPKQVRPENKYGDMLDQYLRKQQKEKPVSVEESEQKAIERISATLNDARKKGRIRRKVSIEWVNAHRDLFADGPLSDVSSEEIANLMNLTSE